MRISFRRMATIRIASRSLRELDSSLSRFDAARFYCYLIRSSILIVHMKGAKNAGTEVSVLRDRHGEKSDPLRGQARFSGAEQPSFDGRPHARHPQDACGGDVRT